MDLILKILAALFYLVAIGTIGFQGYLSWRNHRTWKAVKEKNDLADKKFHELIRQIVMGPEQKKTHLRIFSDDPKNETVN